MPVFDCNDDGRLDVAALVAVPWLPPNIQPVSLRAATRPSIVLLEQ